MRPPFSRSVYGVLWCCARFRQISLISRFSGCSGWARASSLASEPLLSHLTFPVHTSLLSSSHASSTLLTLIRDNHSLIDGTNYLRLKRVQKYPVTETRQVSILFELLRCKSWAFVISDLVTFLSLCNHRFVVFGIKHMHDGTTFHWRMIWVPCPVWYVVFNVSTVEKDVIWWITRTRRVRRFKWNTRRSWSSSEERRCTYLTVLSSLQSLNWPQMRNSMLFYRLEIGCIWESLWGEPSSRPQEPEVWLLWI